MKLCTFWRLKFTNFTKSRPSKKAKTTVLELLDSPKLISRKIWVIGKSWNFQTVNLIFLSYRHVAHLNSNPEIPWNAPAEEIQRAQNFVTNELVISGIYVRLFIGKCFANPKLPQDQSKIHPKVQKSQGFLNSPQRFLRGPLNSLKVFHRSPKRP